MLTATPTWTGLWDHAGARYNARYIPQLPAAAQSSVSAEMRLTL
jgi:hypothetical protein